jgi:uncharacterized membrane protein
VPGTCQPEDIAHAVAFLARAVTASARIKLNETSRGPSAQGGVEMIHSLLVIAVILFVLWLLFHATASLLNLIWIAIIVLVALWLFGFVRGRSAR